MYELRNVSRIYAEGGTEIRAVDGIDLHVPDGDFLTIVGASGSGKSTLLQLLGGLDRATGGAVLWNDQDLGSLPDRTLAELRLHTFGFVFQQFNLIPTLTAAENVEAALAPTRAKAAQRRERSRDLLEQVGLADRAPHLPSKLSGGEQQRVAIARALANAPDVILADEPTGNLDSATSAEIVSLLRGLAGEQTVVMVTHDAAIAAQADRILHMSDGSFADTPVAYG